MFKQTPRAEDPLRWRRRLLSLPAMGLGATLWLSLLPIWLPLCCVVDMLGARRFALSRAGLFLAWLLHWELRGLAVAATTGLRRRLGWPEARYLRAQHRLQHRYARSLWWALERLFGMRLVIEGSEALAAQGPTLAFFRHLSTADTILPMVAWGAPQQVWSRYILKAELAWDPLLDIIGHRLGVAFVARGAEDDLQRVARLTEDLGAHDAVVLFPEGTRFTTDRRAALLRRLRAEGREALVQRVERYRHTLPPREGGATLLFEGAPAADVLLAGHVGLEGVTHLTSLLNGRLIDREVRLRFWRWSAGELPTGGPARYAWLLDQWETLDRWVGDQTASARSGPPGGG